MKQNLWIGGKHSDAGVCFCGSNITRQRLWDTFLPDHFHKLETLGCILIWGLEFENMLTCTFVVSTVVQSGEGGLYEFQ